MRPGEFAGAHNHASSALRFIMEGAGAYTGQMHELKDADDARRTVAYWAEEGANNFKAYMNITHAELAAGEQPLEHAQQGQQQRGGNADGGIGRHHADQGGSRRHQQQGGCLGTAAGA